MTPIEYYQSQCQSGAISEDPQQLIAMQHFQRVFDAIMNEHKKRQSPLAFMRRPHLVKGLYIWGGVGIGKTFMMDCFYHCVPFQRKLRMHFHQFMQMIHQELKKHQGQTDPLQAIAKEIAAKIDLLCFDELFVSDITDAMLLGRLFDALFSRGVCLVTTSNVTPDDLYKNGLQRERFLPAIELLKLNTELLFVSITTDYRMLHLKEAGVFYTPLDAEARNNMEKTFATLTEYKEVRHEPITILGRQIQTKKHTDDIVWFDFSDICTVPRSQNDYLAIAEKYQTVFISDIPIIPAHAKDMICLFVSLVDVFYDARVRLVISAAEPVAQLYSRGHMIFEFARTHSRLLEMQSSDYFLS